MVSIRVFVKLNGIVAPCPAREAEDGAVWLCSRCGNAVIRASFGVMNGRLHCVCGAEVELMVDGQIVDIEELNVLPGTPPRGSLVNEFYEDPNSGLRYVNTPAPAVDDEEFLRGCGISMEEE